MKQYMFLVYTLTDTHTLLRFIKFIKMFIFNDISNIIGYFLELVSLVQAVLNHHKRTQTDLHTEL